MKSKLIFIVFVILSLTPSCTTKKVSNVDQQIEEQPSIEFMERGDIIAMINSEEEFEQKSAIDDPELKTRIDSLIPDETFVKGLKDLKIKEVKKDKLKEIFKDIPTATDLTKFNTPIKTQNNGYCTAYATAASIEASLCRQYGLCAENISEQYLFYQYKQYDTEKALNAAYKYMQVDEQYWPQYKKPVANITKLGHAKITKYTYLGTDGDKILEALARQSFVVIGMRTPSDMVQCRSAIRSTSKFENGGHAILAVAYQKDPKVPGGSYIKIKNSWGSNCGDNGYQYLPITALCKRNDAYCYFWEVETVYTTKANDKNFGPVWKTFCEPVSWKFWNMSKKSRCKQECVKDCFNVCNGSVTCTRPYQD